MAEPATTVLHLLAERARSHPQEDALLVKRYGRWSATTQAELQQHLAALALGFRQSGVEPGTVVALVMRPHSARIFADLALQLIGARVVGIPTGMPSVQMAHVLRDSRARWLVVQNQHLADVVLPFVEEGTTPDVERIVYVDPAGVEDYASPLLMAYAEVEAAGSAQHSDDGRDMQRLLDQVDPDAVAVLSYSSGTTDLPHGVLLTHRNLLAATVATQEALGLGDGDRVLSFRPLSDPVERTATVYPTLASGAVLALPESRAAAQTAMWEIAPTYIHLTPRYVKSIATGIRIRMQASRDVKRLVNRRWAAQFRRALADGRDVAPGAMSRLLVGRPVLEKLGLDKATRVIVSGSRIPTEGLAFFAALGLVIRPAYSLTEVGGFALMPQGEEVRRDTLGTALPGIEARIVDGQLLLRGDAVATHAVGADGPERIVDADGWLATGDAATEVDGEIVVRGRLGDMVDVGQGAPVNLSEVEAKLTASPYIREAVLREHGDALMLTIEPETKSLGRWATQNGVDYTTDRSLLADDRVTALLQRAAESALSEFSGLEVAETHVLTLPLAVADGTLTLNDKVRRHHVIAAPEARGERDSAHLVHPESRESTGAH